MQQCRYFNESTKRYIHCPARRDRVTALLGRAIMEDDASLLERAKKLLDVYKVMEHLSLLELAIRKFVCISNGPPDEEYNTFLAWKLWELEGWKTTKERHAKCKEAYIISTAVLPFLSNKIRGKE